MPSSLPTFPGAVLEVPANDDPLRHLLERAQAGQANAMENLLRAVAPAMLAAARATLGASDADIEDVVQDSLVAIQNSLHTFRGQCRFVHFCRRVTVNVALMARRRRGSRMRTVQELRQRVLATRDGSVSGTEEAERVLRCDLFRQMVGQLPVEQAEALTLLIVLRYTIDEVAALTGVSRNTVRSRERLGKQRIRALVAADSALAEMLGVEA